MGVAFRTLLNAVSATAMVAAFLLLPRLSLPFPSFAMSVFWAPLTEGKTSMPFLISSPRIKKTLRAPAEATAAKGTSRVRIVRVPGERCFKRGTSELRPRATEQEAETARKYDWMRVEVEREVDLLALALLMATLSDWLVICQRRVPVVLRPGVSMPAVTTRLEMTKQDIRKGRKTGWPVSVIDQLL